MSSDVYTHTHAFLCPTCFYTHTHTHTFSLPLSPSLSLTHTPLPKGLSATVKLVYSSSAGLNITQGHLCLFSTKHDYSSYAHIHPHIHRAMLHNYTHATQLDTHFYLNTQMKLCYSAQMLQNTTLLQYP